MTTNKLYRQFLDTGLIKTIEIEELNNVLNKIKGNVKEGRALLILLYYTGARPVEILNLKGTDIKKDSNYVIIQMPYSKRGKSRPIYLQYSQPLVKEIYMYARSVPPEMFIFYHFKGHYQRVHTTKKGEKRIYIETANKVRYYVKKWFEAVGLDITTYYLRHNRFSKAALAGLSDREIKQLKGSGSIEAYTHLSAKTAKEVAKKIK